MRTSQQKLLHSSANSFCHTKNKIFDQDPRVLVFFFIIKGTSIGMK